MRERNEPQRPSRSSAGRNAALGTMCLALNVAMTLALQSLLRTLTGDTWFLVSLAAAFLAVSLMYGTLEGWCGLTPEARQTSPLGEN